MQITKNHIEAMNDLLKMVEPWIEKGPDDINSTEPISILAILAGSFLFRSFEFKLDNLNPGSVINIHSEWEQSKEKELIVITQSSLELIDVETDLNTLILNNQYIEQKTNFIDIISKVQEPALQIMKKYNLTYDQMAQSAAIATSYYIQQREKNTIEEGFKTAIYYYFVGSRTCPPDFAENILNKKLDNPIKQETNLSKQNLRPWWKF
ncbi:MAG: hypothetical protein RBR28_13865 [Lentimicrobium sp.]|jgi:hypothetical protein|nr:hypothetical protein [Lentimicrobium sp.]